MISFITIILLVGMGTSFSDPYLNPGTGISFPDNLAGMVKTSVVDYEKKLPGLGTSVGYNGPRIAAMIYVYTMGMIFVPDTIDSPGFVSHFRQTAEDIFWAGRQGLWNNVKKTSEEVLFIGPPETGQKALCNSFSYSRNNDEFLSKLCLFAYKNHFVKIRFTYGRDIKDQAEETFAKLLEFLTNEIKAGQNKAVQPIAEKAGSG
jgi:hypothetical protein